MDPEVKENLQKAEWTMIIQKVIESQDPLVYKIIMRYYGEEPVPIMKCEEECVEWTKQDS